MVGAGKESLTSNVVNTGPQKQLAGGGAVGGGSGGAGEAGEDDLDAMLKSLNQK